jgi:hypothetical protein
LSHSTRALSPFLVPSGLSSTKQLKGSLPSFFPPSLPPSLPSFLPFSFVRVLPCSPDWHQT